MHTLFDTCLSGQTGIAGVLFLFSEISIAQPGDRGICRVIFGAPDVTFCSCVKIL